jgi:hypothetical protein
MQWRISFFMLFVSLLVGYNESSRAKADPVPNPCLQFECRTVHAYWTGNAGYIWVVHVKDGDSNADNGTVDIFTTNSVEKKPIDTTGTETVDHWNYSGCTPLCGKDANGKWQAVQEVAKGGEKIPNSKVNLKRTPCKANGGQEGPTINPPVNANKDGNTPPGWKKEDQ